MQAIEICAGAGGMALGFERAGWNHDLLIENEPLRCQVLLRNRPGWPVICADIREILSGDIFLPVYGLDDSHYNPDLLCGGVPCQPVSRAGKRKLDKDDRDLWPLLPELIEKLKPRMVCFENVPGDADNPSVRDLADYLVERGWGWTWWKLNAVHFGIPQTRERWFFVAHEGAGVFFDPSPPEPVCLCWRSRWSERCGKCKSIEDALAGDWGVASTLPNWLAERLEKSGVMISGKNANKGFSSRPQKSDAKQTRGLDEPSFAVTASAGRRHRVVTPTLHTESSYDKARDIDEPSQTVTGSAGRRRRIVVRGSQKREERPLDGPMFTIGASRQQKHRIVEGVSISERNSARKNGPPTVRALDEPSMTVDKDGRFRIADGLRVWAMTEKQLQKLQAFPDDWLGMTTDMIGDAVPPPLAEAVGRRLAEILRGE